MTAQSSQSVLINGFGVLFVILNSFGLGLRLSVGKLLAEAFAHWKIAVWALVINFVNNQAASERRPAPANLDVTSDPLVVADLPDEGEFFLVPVGANPPRW